MFITFVPMRHSGCLKLYRQGDCLTINGETFDFSPLPDGATLPREAVTCHWLVSDVVRIGGRIHLSLILPHGADAPAAARFPEPLTLEDDGPVALPFSSQADEPESVHEH